MEWEVLQNIVPDLVNVKQVGLEVHLTRPDTPLNISKAEYIEKFLLLKKLETTGFKKFQFRLNPFGTYKSNVSGLTRSLFYELHYLNFNFVEPDHLKLGQNSEAGPEKS